MCSPRRIIGQIASIAAEAESCVNCLYIWMNERCLSWAFDSCASMIGESVAAKMNHGMLASVKAIEYPARVSRERRDPTRAWSACWAAKRTKLFKIRGQLKFHIWNTNGRCQPIRNVCLLTKWVVIRERKALAMSRAIIAR